MRDRASVRMKPMTATATTMVKAIWRAYFVRTGQQQAPGKAISDLFTDDPLVHHVQYSEKDADGGLLENLLVCMGRSRESLSLLLFFPSRLGDVSMAFCVGISSQVDNGKRGRC